MKNNFFLINKNTIGNYWLNFWDSKFLYNIWTWKFFFLKKILNYLFREYFNIFNNFKNIKFICGRIWIYFYTDFFIFNFNIVNIKKRLKIKKKKNFFFILKNFEW